MKSCQLAIIGGGPAGLAAAVSAYEAGLHDIVIFERDRELGGVLNQCIHNGFGLHYFKEELTGPEYAGRFMKMLPETAVRVMSDTMVLDVSGSRKIRAINATDGLFETEAQTVILAMGCRERTRGAISIPGTRCSGILTAGAAQRYVNIDGYMVGKKIVVLGSGDIGLIMARRMTLEGAKVLACVELMPYSSGLDRNIVQCLHDFDIPLLLSHTITDIEGDARLKSVTVSKVGTDRRPIAGTERKLECDTLLLSVGLIPENELSRQAGIAIDRCTSGPFVYENMETSIPGVFACGNVVHVHDLVDFVTEEAIKAGKSAAEFVLGRHTGSDTANTIELISGDHVTYTVPQRIRPSNVEARADVSFRVNRSFGDSRIVVSDGEKKIASFRRSHMAPGEMDHISIPRSLLDIVQTGRITVSCEEVSA